jgi:PAS domain S-box-containing protein
MPDSGFMPLRIEEVRSRSDELTDALRFRRSLEIETVGVLLFGPEGEILEANDAFLRMGGWTREDVCEGRLRWNELTPAEWQPVTRRALEQFQTLGSVAPYEKQYFRKDGSLFWVYIASKRLSDTEGIAFVLDTTERKEAEARLQESQATLEKRDEQLQTITDALPALIAYVDTGLHYVRVNRAYARYFNTVPEELVGRPMREVLGGTFAEIEPHLQRALAGEAQQFEVSIAAAFGERQMLAQHVPDVGPDGAVRGVVIQSHDMTERKKTEHMLKTAEKLAAVGRLAASMAHEINNPLEAVTNLLYLARTSSDAEGMRMFLAQAEVELRRVSDITNQTLRFHKQSTKPAPARPEALFASALAVYAGRLRNGDVVVEQRLRAVEPVVCFDGEIRQVLSNLLSNALDAMAGRKARLLLRACAGTDWQSGRRGLKLTVGDTGVGMTRAVLKNIWEPFFTTKEVGGTGLGLWISRDIAERHGGTLHVRSRAGVGTVFCLWLPSDAVVRSRG